MDLKFCEVLEQRLDIEGRVGGHDDTVMGAIS